MLWFEALEAWRSSGRVAWPQTMARWVRQGSGFGYNRFVPRSLANVDCFGQFYQRFHRCSSRGRSEEPPWRGCRFRYRTGLGTRTSVTPCTAQAAVSQRSPGGLPQGLQLLTPRISDCLPSCCPLDRRADHTLRNALPELGCRALIAPQVCRAHGLLRQHVRCTSTHAIHCSPMCTCPDLQW